MQPLTLLAKFESDAGDFGLERRRAVLDANLGGAELAAVGIGAAEGIEGLHARGGFEMEGVLETQMVGDNHGDFLREEPEDLFVALAVGVNLDVGIDGRREHGREGGALAEVVAGGVVDRDGAIDLASSASSAL